MTPLGPLRGHVVESGLWGSIWKVLVRIRAQRTGVVDERGRRSGWWPAVALLRGCPSSMAVAPGHYAALTFL